MLWMTPEIKRMILENAKIYRRYVKHGRSFADYQILSDITSRWKSAIKEAKSNYFSRLGDSLNNLAVDLFLDSDSFYNYILTTERSN